MITFFKNSEVIIENEAIGQDSCISTRLGVDIRDSVQHLHYSKRRKENFRSVFALLSCTHNFHNPIIRLSFKIEQNLSGNGSNMKCKLLFMCF